MGGSWMLEPNGNNALYDQLTVWPFPEDIAGFEGYPVGDHGEVLGRYFATMTPHIYTQVAKSGHKLPRDHDLGYVLEVTRKGVIGFTPVTYNHVIYESTRDLTKAEVRSVSLIETLLMVYAEDTKHTALNILHGFFNGRPAVGYLTTPGGR